NRTSNLSSGDGKQPSWDGRTEGGFVDSPGSVAERSPVREFRNGDYADSRARRSAARKSSSRFDMAKSKMDSIERSGVVALILLCHLTKVSCRQEKEEAAQRLTEAQNTLCSRNTALEGAIKHWEFLYGLLDKHTRVLAEKNKHFEVNWPKHENMLNTRIQHRDGVIRGLTESNKTLSRKNADLDQIRHRDAAIVRLNKEKEFLFQKLAVTTKKYNVLKVESLNILAEKPDMSLMRKSSVQSQKSGQAIKGMRKIKSLAEKFRKDMAEKKESWASLTKLIKEKLQKIEDKKTHLEEMPTKVLPEKQESLAEEVNLKFEVLKLEEKVTEDSAVKQHSVETVVVTELKQEETSTKDLVDKPNCSEMKVTKMIEIFVMASLDTNNTQEQHPTNVYHDMGVTRNKIVTAQFECYQKIMKDDPQGREEPVCNRTWDGWLCWDDTTAGANSEQHCPDYFQDFDPSEMVNKICTDSGLWFLHQRATGHGPTTPAARAHQRRQSDGHESLLLGSHRTWPIPDLALRLPGDILPFQVSHQIYSYHALYADMSLSCQRITLHKNLFFSFVLNSVITMIWLTGVANNQELVQRNPTSCKVSQFIHLYLFACNYFWMLCEGIYLHTLIVVAVFAEKQHLMWYYLLGWATIHAVARSYYYNDNCWISSKTSLLYIIHGPICAALLVNLFFLLNIVRVLITKLKVTHQAESSLYMKAVRATLILVPLLGIQYVLFPYKPEGRVSSEIYDYIMHILMHYQGLLVATIFCFFNGEVQAVLRRHWNQYNIQFGSSIGNHSEAMRSASYTASSITEVQGCYSIDGHTEHMNGKGFHDADASILKSDSPFA
ncbi:hypothetical protein F7725_001681, partial [Dissostichus mawsoni]